MKRYLLALLSVVFLAGWGYSQSVKIDLGAKQSWYHVSAQSDYGFDLRLTLSELTAVKKSEPAGEFYRLQAPNLIKSFGNGEPMLPIFSRLIKVPFGADVKVEVVSAKSEVIRLSDYGIDAPLYPAQPSQFKNQDPKFVYDKSIYQKNSFYKKPLVSYHESGIMRDLRFGRLEICPFEYNPVTNELKVYYDLKVKVSFEHPDLSLTKRMAQVYGLPMGHPSSYFLNELPSRKDMLGIPTSFPLTYVIVAPSAFQGNAVLNQFIEWKKLQGYNVIVGYTGQDMGTTESDIKSWLQDLYNNPPAGANPPAFVLFIGDVSNMPSHQFTEITSSPYSDLYYVEYTGDYHPEILFGRVSAESATELEAALTKIMYYERDQFQNDYSHLHQVLMVAGDDESHEDTWGNGQIWYGVNYYFNEEHNIYSHTFYQDPEDHGVPGGNAAVHDSILADVSAGLSFANYSAHCSPDGWYSPSFTVSDLSTLTNTNKYGVWIGNCCQSFQFVESDAFGEVALYIADKGAAAYIGGSESTLWDEDYYWGVGLGDVVAQPQYDQTGRGAYDASFHDRANEVNDPSVWAINVRQIIDAGNLAVEASGSSYTNYYWVIYQVSGDPSMLTRIGTPQTATLSLAPMIVGTNEITGTTLPYAFVSVTQDGNLIGVGMADATGNISITTVEPIPAGMLHVVVYGQNMTVLEQDIAAFVPNDPYLLVTDINPDTVTFNSDASFTLTIGNINDSLDADSVYVLATVTDSNVTLLQDSLWIGAFGAGDTTEFADAITAHVGIVPDRYAFRIYFQIHGVREDTSYVWESNKMVVVRAPKLNIAQMEFVDPEANGYLDIGANDTLLVTVNNVGGADADNVKVWVSCTNDEVILPDTVTVSVPADSSVVVQLPVVIPSDATEGVKTWFYVNIEQDIYADNDSLMRWVGQPAELIVGNGTEEVHYPLYNFYENERTQILYTADQMVGAHMISSIGFQLTSAQSAWDYQNFKIYMMETTMSELPEDDYVDISNAVLVYERSTYSYDPSNVGDNNFLMFNLDRPFFYTGSGNLLVEVVWGDNGQYQSSTSSLVCYGTNVGYNAVSYGLADSETPPTHDATTTSIPNTKFEFTAISGAFVMVPEIYTDTVLHESDVHLPVSVRNYGNDTANDVVVVLRSYDSGITVIDSLVTIDEVAPNETVTIGDAFLVHVDALENGHRAKLGIVTPNGEQDAYLIVAAPQLKLVGYGLVNDTLGYLPGGQSGQYSVKIANIGGDIAPATEVTLEHSYTDILTVGTADAQDIVPGDTVEFVFPVVAADIDSVVRVEFSAQAVTGSYSFSCNPLMWINQVIEGYVGAQVDSVYKYPFYQYYKNEKTQILFYPDNLDTVPAKVYAYGVYVTYIEDEVLDLVDFTISMFSTNANSVGSGYLSELGDRKVVYHADYYTPHLGWNIWQFDEPFFVDGTHRFVVEIVWGQLPRWISDKIYVATKQTAVNTVAYGYADTETPPTFDYAADDRPYSYFQYAPTPVQSTEVAGANNISIAPNPTNGKFVIYNAQNAKVTILDLAGHQVLVDQIKSDAQSFDISNLSSGVYMVQLQTADGLHVFKLIKK